MGNKSIRTDLAFEVLEGEKLFAKGVDSRTEEKNGLKITRVRISPEAVSQMGKPAGSYVTIEVDSFEAAAQNTAEEISAAAEEIKTLLPEQGLVLVAGLGNNDITPDALGPKTIDGIMATRHFKGELADSTGLSSLRSAAAIAPGVLGQTGIETAEILSSLVKSLSPAAVVVVDALASKSIDRLGKTIQISDTGISPGAGVQNRRQEISLQTLGIPVIAVGVPTVVDMTTIAQELSNAPVLSERGNTMMVTPRDIDLIVEKSAQILSLAINKALQPKLSIADIAMLVS